MELHFNSAALAELGLPDRGYPISIAALDQAIGDRSNLPFAAMLDGLQQASAVGGSSWQELEPAMARLAELIADGDDRSTLTAAGDNWWVEIAPIDLSGPVVTVQRGETLVAAIAARADGRLRLGAYRPLDSRSARLIMSIALHSHPDDGKVCMRANNWEYALDCSAGSGQWYAADRGEAYLSWWGEGLGAQQDGTVLEDWAAMVELAPRPAAQVAIELGVAYAFGS